MHSSKFADVAAWVDKFEDPVRDSWQQPQRVLDAMELMLGHVVADIGSATGYFPVRLARAVPLGRVWAVDCEPAMVRYLKERAHREKLGNLYSILATESSAMLPEPVHRILMVNSYHHIHDRPSYFQKLTADLLPGGRVVIVDLRMGDLSMGPPDDHKIPPDQIIGELQQAGYELIRHLDILPMQHVMLFGIKP